MNIEISIKLLDNELILDNMTFNVYKKNIKITSDELEKAHLSCTQEYELIQ